MVLLYDGHDGSHRHGDAQNQVKGDEELMQLALADEGAGVVAVTEAH